MRHCVTSRKVAGSIPDFVTGIWHYDPGVDSTCNVTEYHKYFLGGKGGRCLGLITLPPSCVECHEIWEPQPPGRQGLYRDFFFIFTFIFTVHCSATNIEVPECLIGHYLPGNCMLLGNAVRHCSQGELYFSVRLLEEETSPYIRVIRCIN